MAMVAKRLAAGILALSLLILSATPVGAWGWYFADHATWPNHDITFCFDPSAAFPYDSMKATVRHGVAAWRDTGANLTLTEVSYGGGMGGQCGIKIHYLSFSARGWPVVYARTSPVEAFGMIYTADMYFNSDIGSRSWWYTSSQTAYNGCYVGITCKANAFAYATHEAGHAIGVGHDTTDNSSHCNLGYVDTAVVNACDVYGESPMYWNAADGYMRPLTQQDIIAARTMYGT